MTHHNVPHSTRPIVFTASATIIVMSDIISASTSFFLFLPFTHLTTWKYLYADASLVHRRPMAGEAVENSHSVDRPTRTGQSHQIIAQTSPTT